MKRKHLLWLLMVALVVPMLTMSCKDTKRYRDMDDEESEVTEKKENKKLIFGEYELEQESLEAIFGEEMKSLKTEQGMNSDINSRFFFNDDDELDCDFTCKFSQYIPDIANTMKLDFVLKMSGTWQHDKGEKTLTIKFRDVDVKDFKLSFAKENSTTKAIRDQIGGEEDMKKQMMKEMDLETFKKTTVFNVTRLMPDGFSVTVVDGDGQRIKFKKVD